MKLVAQNALKCAFKGPSNETELTGEPEPYLIPHEAKPRERLPAPLDVFYYSQLDFFFVYSKLSAEARRRAIKRKAE